MNDQQNLQVLNLRLLSNTINNVFGETPVRRSQRGELCDSFSCSFLYSVYLIRQSVSDFSGNRRPEPRRSVYCHGSASSDDYDSVHHLQAAGSRPAAQSVRRSLFSLRLPARQRSADRDHTRSGSRTVCWCDASSRSFEGLRQGDAAVKLVLQYLWKPGPARKHGARRDHFIL